MIDTESKTEETLIQNSFGTVTSKRVIYYREKGWFSGGSREDIPLQHVTSVRLDISRNIISGLLFLLIALPFISTEGEQKIIGIILSVVGVLFIFGSPSVVVNTAGRDLNAAKGFPWKRGEAKSFVEALRNQLFKS